MNLTEPSSTDRIALDPLFWNDTPFRTYLFDAFSVLLPAGEQFVIDAVAQGAEQLPASSPLREPCERFVREERAHQRAHRSYNAQLEDRGYPVRAEEAKLSRELAFSSERLTLAQRLCLAAAFEHITAGVSHQALRSERLLADNASRQVRMWRWHCAEELGHSTVVRDLLAVHGVRYPSRVGWFALAGWWLAWDLARIMRLLYETDAQLGRVAALRFWRGVLSQAARSARDLVDVARHSIAYFLPAQTQSAAAIGLHDSPAVLVRPLQEADVPNLLQLEQRCWTPEQAATEAQLRSRIRQHPELSLGAFCRRSGAALGSLFMKPIDRSALERARTWHDCVHGVDDGHCAKPTDALFGISLSSVHPASVDAIMKYFWPQALRSGWRHIYLGSPIPGLRRWLQSRPDGRVEDYVHSSRRGLPLDPQLRYYHRRGFRRVVSVHEGYFPHDESLDHAALLHGTIPGSRWSMLWRCLPTRLLDRMSHLLFRLL